MTLLVMTAASCSNEETPTPTPTPDNKYMGEWEGVFSGGDNGTWDISVDKEGKFTGEIHSGNSGNSYPFTGSFDADGKIATEIDVNGVILDFDGSGSADGKTASGTWGNSGAGISGVWSGAKK
ncbi:MAG TPA: hypothetical protein DIW47_01910 [Bacteroidetes bacterium]|nr:hypothetical protein [Bacteroidota bacterium]